MPLPTETQVLIVGAGPIGMACAITLVSLGLKVTIVDAYPTNKNGSRSVVIHAHTLEVLNTLGLAEQLMDEGIPSRGPTIHGTTNKLLQVDVGQLRDETKFPVVLLIPQHDVERILRDKLAASGVEILRPHTVVGMKEASSDGGLEVTFDDGSIVRSRYVVGADGSRSTIRRLAGIDFKDPATGVDYDGEMPASSTFQIILADVYLEEPLLAPVPHDSISFHLNKFYFLVPLRSGEDSVSKSVSLWRIGIAARPDRPPPPQHPDTAYIQEELNDRWSWESKPHVVSVKTASRYRVREAVASVFFKKFGKGSVLLAGDSAHVHSPVGGQGMNLGICDAVALGHSIHAHMARNPKIDTDGHFDTPLEHYSVSRRALAIRVIGMTGALTTIVSANTGWRRVARNVLVWIVGRSPFLRRAVTWRLSGLSNRDADGIGH